MTRPTPIVNKLAASWTSHGPAVLSLLVLVATSARQIAPTRTPAATTPAVAARPGPLAAAALRVADFEAASSPLTGAGPGASTQLTYRPSCHRGQPPATVQALGTIPE